MFTGHIPPTAPQWHISTKVIQVLVEARERGKDKYHHANARVKNLVLMIVLFGESFWQRHKLKRPPFPTTTKTLFTFF